MPGEALPVPWPYAKRIELPNAFLVTGESFFTTYSFYADEKLAEAIRCMTGTLWIFGHVDYIDAFEGRYRGGYVRTYHPGLDDGEKNNLAFPAGADYNYDVEREKGDGNDWGRKKATYKVSQSPHTVRHNTD